MTMPVQGLIRSDVGIPAGGPAAAHQGSPIAANDIAILQALKQITISLELPDLYQGIQTETGCTGRAVISALTPRRYRHSDYII